jgi:hypothetical protein
MQEIQAHLEQLSQLLAAVQNAWAPLGIVDTENGTNMAVHLAVLTGICLGFDDNIDAMEQNLGLMQHGAELAQALEEFNNLAQAQPAAPEGT